MKVWTPFQSDVKSEDKSVDTPVGTTTDDVENVAADSDEPGVKPDEGKPDTSDAGRSMKNWMICVFGGSYASILASVTIH